MRHGVPYELHNGPRECLGNTLGSHTNAVVVFSACNMVAADNQYYNALERLELVVTVVVLDDGCLDPELIILI